MRSRWRTRTTFSSWGWSPSPPCGCSPSGSNRGTACPSAPSCAVLPSPSGPTCCMKPLPEGRPTTRLTTRLTALTKPLRRIATLVPPTLQTSSPSTSQTSSTPTGSAAVGSSSWAVSVATGTSRSRLELSTHHGWRPAGTPCCEHTPCSGPATPETASSACCPSHRTPPSSCTI